MEQHQQAHVITRETDDHRGESYDLLVEELAKAKRYCTEALSLDVLETSYQAALVLGIVLLHQRQHGSDTFADAVARSQSLLRITPDLYEPHYALATAYVGQAVCDPRWADACQHAELLAPALAEYRRALEITSAPGVVSDALRGLELIQAAGVAGLEQVFDLLKSALK